MLLAAFIVQEGLAADALLQHLVGDPDSLCADFSVGHGHFQSIQRRSRVPVGKSRDGGKLGFGYLYVLVSVTCRIFQGIFQKLYQVFFFQGMEDKDPAPGQESPVYFKGGILRGGSNQDNASFFHKGKKSVLLGFVKPVNLVHKQHGPQTHFPAFLRLGHDFPDFFDAACDGTEIDEFGPGSPGDNAGQSGFPHSRRSPEYHGRYLVFFYQTAKHLSFSKQMLLPHELFQGPGP